MLKRMWFNFCAGNTLVWLFFLAMEAAAQISWLSDPSSLDGFEMLMPNRVPFLVFLVMFCSGGTMVRLAVGFGQTRKAVAVDLAAGSLVVALALCASVFLVDQLTARFAAGAWMDTSLLWANSWLLSLVFGSLGTLVSVLVVRFGWRVGIIGLVAFLLAWGAVALLMGLGASGFFGPAAAAWVQAIFFSNTLPMLAARAAAALAVWGASSLLCLRLLRRYSIS